jgi:hypothetical protein
MGFLNRRDEQVNSAISWLFMGGELVLIGAGIALLALGVSAIAGWILIGMGGLIFLVA